MFKDFRDGLNKANWFSIGFKLGLGLGTAFVIIKAIEEVGQALGVYLVNHL